MLEISSLHENQIIRLNELAQIREDSDEFRVLDLFHGGMGVCIRVRNELSGNEYALKTVQTAFVEEHLSWAMFIEEMKTWLTLSSCDGIVEAFCIARINELPYVCAKWMKGGDLRPLITTKDVDFFYKNIIRIIRTLEWANTKHKIIHRDLKPENILLDTDGLAYVTDWGLARPIAETTPKTNSSDTNRLSSSRPELTQAGEFRGTILYASPEQIMGLKTIDHRSDIYSFGCILYEWETGKPPFLGHTAEEIAYKHLLEPIPRIGSFLRQTNFGIEKIIEKCLEKDANKRFQDYASLADAVVESARKRGVHFNPYIPRERYSMPEIGCGEFNERFQSKDIAGNSSKDGKHRVIEFEEIAPYIREADALMAIGEWWKASEIYGRLFIPEMVLSNPDDDYCRVISVNYANCLIQIGDAERATLVLKHLEKSQFKSAEYFVNLSLAYLHLQKPKQAEETAKQGLLIYENDKDLYGNLLISQIHQAKHSEALQTAQKRLQLGRDVHVLEEVATLLRQIAGKYVETNLPEAVKYFRRALDLLLEAKKLNPRYITARLSLANVLFDIQQYSEAIDELNEMFKLPMHTSIQEMGIVQFAECLDRLGMHKECLDFCNKWLAKFPENISLQRIRAETIVDGFCIGRTKDGTRIVERSSLEFFESVIEKDERHVSDFCYLARLYEWIGKVDEAMELLDEAELLEPDYWEISFNRASFLLRSNELETSLTNALKATQIASWKPQTWKVLARVYSSLDLEQEAKQATDKAEFVERKREELFNV